MWPLGLAGGGGRFWEVELLGDAQAFGPPPMGLVGGEARRFVSGEVSAISCLLAGCRSLSEF